jgi:RNA polymerase sigma factor (sigma-70 family)
MLEDAQLLRRYVEENSDAAFAELVQRNISLVYSAALRLVGGDAHRAKDVTQIVFTTLARRAGSLTHHPVLTGWLYTTTHHAATRTMRGEWRRQAREKEAHAMQEMLSDHTPAIDWERVRPELDAMMRQLGERDREAVLLRYFERRPFAEIGTVLHLSEDAARMRVERALEKLRTLLVGRGVTSTSAALGLVLTQQAAVAAPLGLAGVVSGAALAGSAASGTTLLTLFNLMSATKVTLALGVAGTLAVISAVYQTNRAEAATTKLAVSNANFAMLQIRQRTLEKRIEIAATGQREFEKKITEQHARPAVTQAVAVPPPAPPDPMEHLIQTDPQFRQLFIQQGRADLAHRYIPFFKSLNFTPEQKEQFMDMTTNYLQRLLLQPDGFRKLMSGPPEEVFHLLRSGFGDTVAQRFAAFERSIRAQDLSNVFVGVSYYTDDPYTPRQAEQLTQMIANASPTFRAGGEWEETSVNWDEVLAQAVPHLSPTQLAAARSIAGRMRMNQQMREAEAAARAAAH